MSKEPLKETKIVKDQHQDEELSVSGSDVESGSDNSQEVQASRQPVQQQRPNQRNETLESNKPAAVQGAYKPSDYASLPVSNEVKELFKYISRYTPVTIEIDTKLKAFIPDYVPTVGEVDAFIKMPRPDGQPQTLGLNILDQPSLNMSDKAKIELLMAHSMKQYREDKYKKIHAIENADKNPKQIMTWINSVGDIHKNKQPPSVSYSKQMPDIDSLMQEWPPEVEEVLSEIKLPSEDLDVSLEDYCKIACNILDIPVHESNTSKNIIESLHVMFSLYSAFKQNQHFQANNQNQSYVDAR